MDVKGLLGVDDWLLFLTDFVVSLTKTPFHLNKFSPFITKDKLVMCFSVYHIRQMVILSSAKCFWNREGLILAFFLRYRYQALLSSKGYKVCRVIHVC